jgi:hypothetical protein
MTSKATFVPAVPAVTETKVVEESPEVPAKVVLELTVEDAARLRALLGRTKMGHLHDLTHALYILACDGHIEMTYLNRLQGPISLEY